MLYNTYKALPTLLQVKYQFIGRDSWPQWLEQASFSVLLEEGSNVSEALKCFIQKTKDVVSSFENKQNVTKYLSHWQCYTVAQFPAGIFQGRMELHRVH